MKENNVLSCWFAFNSSQFLVLEVELTIVDGGRNGDGEQKNLLWYVNE